MNILADMGWASLLLVGFIVFVAILKLLNRR